MDITEILQTAVHSNNYWKHSDFSSVTEALSSHYSTDIEMETEKITLLNLGNKTIGYICLNHPLIFIENQYALQVKNVLHSFHDIGYIVVDTLNNQCLSVNHEVYHKYFNWIENLNTFSAEEFSFYHIT
ncbi:hypothetical protein BBH99_15025 [Chryseobacterium contaminans]|uniref:Uncharacterized protein n=1 Tax=Chryseobacterium contaminans TaxID=1423959 RepID=A0A1M6XCE6_9FLAO|nr:hypothetical protein [Chryseobacterium contaminans]OCA68660.1 hypothetical protein BBH99_15025 [Chryseobacterium contaminans]SHL03621.1 hypothetical protein SAMN05444407_10220 [Chryseobacterium contaminans]